MRTSFIIPVFIAITTLLFSCKKENSRYNIGGKVYDARTNQGMGDVNVTVKKQLVQSGTFSSSFSTAVTGNSAADGTFMLTWDRENFAALELSCSRDQYITVERELIVDNFRPGGLAIQNIEMHPEAFVEVNITNNGFMGPDDFFGFTFTNAQFDCTCCSNGWREFEGANIDTTFQCKLYGDTWLKYMNHIISGDLDTTISDSIYCPAFQTVQIDLDY